MEIGVKTLIKNSGILVLSNASLKAISFFLLPLYTNVLPPEAYGASDTILNASTLMAALFSLSLDWGMNTYFYEQNNDSFYRKVTSSGMFYFMLGSLGCLSCVFFSGQISVFLLKDTDYKFAVTLGIMSACIKLIYFSQRVSTRMRGRLDMVGIFSVAELLFTLLCNVFFILICHMGYISILWSNLIGQGVVAFLYTVDARHYLSAKAIDFALLKKMMAYSIPITPTLLFDWINNCLDRYFIGYYFSQADVGLYGIGARIVGILSVMTGAFLSAYPSFAYANAKKSENRAQYGMVMDFLVMGLSIIAAAVTLFSREIVHVMTAEEYHSAYKVVGILLYAHIVHVLGVVAGYGVTIQKKGILYLRISGMGALINIVANACLVPEYSYQGAAAATLITEVIMFFISYRYSCRLFDCGYNLMKIVFCIVVSLGTSYGAVLLVFPMKIAAFIGISAVTGMIYRDRVIYLWKYLRTIKKG